MQAKEKRTQSESKCIIHVIGGSDFPQETLRHVSAHAIPPKVERAKQFWNGKQADIIIGLLHTKCGEQINGYDKERRPPEVELL